MLEIPGYRSGFAVVAFKSKIWLLGGSLCGDELSKYQKGVFAFNPQSRLWTKKKSMKNARANFGAVVVGNSLYAIGGVNNDGEGGKSWDCCKTVRCCCWRR